GYIVAGTQQIGGIQYDLALLKFDGSGNLQWAQLGQCCEDDTGNSVRQTSDGGYIVAGATRSVGVEGGRQSALLLKYDGAGTLQWARFVGEIGVDLSANSVQQTSDGGYIVAGPGFGTGLGQNVSLLKFDGFGTLQWARILGNSTSGASVP